MKLLIGGSPCTHWSIAQTKNRETKPEGLGWELFKNFLIAREKFQPDYFLYENNKSMSAAIRQQITAELGVEPILINSALVSAQNRQRLYWTNIPGVEQPEDLGILLRDILETGLPLREKAYTLRANYANTGPGASSVASMAGGGHFSKNGAAELVGKPLTEREIEYMVRETEGGRNHFDFAYHHDATKEKSQCVTANVYRGVPYNVLVEPVRIGTIESAGTDGRKDSRPHRVYSTEGKSVTLTSTDGGMGSATGLYAVPCAGRIVGRRINADGHRDDYNESLEHIQRYEVNENPDKTNCLTTVQKDNMVAVPVRVGDMPNAAGEISGSQSGRVYGIEGKSVPLQARPNGGGADGAATGLYAVPCKTDRDPFRVPEATAQGYCEIYPGECVDLSMEHSKTRRGRRMAEKSNCLTTSCAWYEYCGTLDRPIYHVEDGQITIRGRKYPIQLRDGCYIIRKLTVRECMRLQTVPEEYIFPVSDTQAYKMLGNGWTVDVIAHILHYAPGITEEPLQVLSMYDGMSCGHIALDKLGANIVRYWATEVDKHAIKTTQHNFPDVVQLGDAFQVRDDEWSLPGLAVEEPKKDVGHIATLSIITERARACVLSLSYGKDSLACLGAIEQLGWPLDRIVHAEVWATDTIPADLPPMVEFKARADAIIKERWGITVEHVCAMREGRKLTYEKQFYTKRKNAKNENKIHVRYGWPYQMGAWCNSRLKVSALSRSCAKDSVSYRGIAIDEPVRLARLDGVTAVSPLAAAGWTETMCREWCEENNLLSPIYTDSARGGCWFCHNQPIGQLRILRRNYPDYWALMLRWDSDSPVTFDTRGRTLHDYERRFRLEDEGLLSPDDKVFRWEMLDQELNYRLF